jgi:16S rRNA (cytidine1402-2'-O)-methyltransferase
MLYIVATPIGNLKDITLRSLEVLKDCDGVICEDSRRTGLLLNQYQIHKPLLILNDFNEVRELPKILELLKIGQRLTLVSDAGTPLVSDPGYKLVRECLNNGLEVDSLPGPSSILTALTLSGLPPDKFIFLGYLPEKPGKRADLLSKLSLINKEIPATFLAFVPPHKLSKTLSDMKEVLGDIEVVLARELTKIHQTVKKQTVSLWMEELKKQPPKGEYVMLFRTES